MTTPPAADIEAIRKPLTDELAAINEISRLVIVARGAACKIRSEMKRSGRLMYGAAEVDWLVNDADNFLKANKLCHQLYDAVKSPLSTQGAGVTAERAVGIDELARAIYEADPTLDRNRKPVPWDTWANRGLGVMSGRKRIAYNIADAIMGLKPAGDGEVERLAKERDEALVRAQLSAEMSGALILAAIGPGIFERGTPIYKDEALKAVQALKARAEAAESALALAQAQVEIIRTVMGREPAVTPGHGEAWMQVSMSLAEYRAIKTALASIPKTPEATQDDNAASVWAGDELLHPSPSAEAGT